MVVVSSDEVPGQEILPLEGTVADHERILNATAMYANAPWYATSRLKRDKAFAMKLVMTAESRRAQFTCCSDFVR